MLSRHSLMQRSDKYGAYTAASAERIFMYGCSWQEYFALKGAD